jgi:hypothetical protein
MDIPWDVELIDIDINLVKLPSDIVIEDFDF